MQFRAWNTAWVASRIAPELRSFTTKDGSQAGTGAYATAVDLLSTGKVKVKPMITHVVSLHEAARGFELAASHDENVFRVVMQVSPS